MILLLPPYTCFATLLTKKAKSDEISRLTKLGFQGVLKEIEYKPLILGDHRAPKVNIPSNIDAADPLALLDLFHPSCYVYYYCREY
jgi:hypothetical protein